MFSITAIVGDMSCERDVVDEQEQILACDSLLYAEGNVDELSSCSLDWTVVCNITKTEGMSRTKIKN